MNYIFEERNDALVIEYSTKDNFREFTQIKYTPDSEYPLSTEVVENIKDLDKPVVFHNSISHEDYKFICEQFKMPLDRGYGNHKIWVAICLYNHQETAANNTIRVFWDATKNQMLASHHPLLREKLKRDKKKEIEISFCVNYGIRRTTKMVIDEKDELYTKTDEEIYEMIKKVFTS